MNGDKRYWITVAETKPFMAGAASSFSEQELFDLTTYLALDPETGEVIPDTDGVRVLAWELAREGMPCEVHVVYFYYDLNTPVYLLGVLTSGIQPSFTNEQKARARALVAEIINNCGGSKVVKLRPNSAA